ncbi:MAG: transcription termination/antitermination protein NusG [Coxiellaceae bacterium]|nr:transcription termination/antitermination protein NusG [Coxiellaceae bacterium]
MVNQDDVKQPQVVESEEQAKKRWYIIQARSGLEDRAVKLLEEAIRINGVEEYFEEVVVPTEEVVAMRAGQKRKSERKFFPGYVLVKMVMNEKTWHIVKEVKPIVGFLGGDKPTPLSNAEADKILQRVQDSADKPSPRILFEPGEVVRVIDGPFADFNGVVEDVNYEKSRLRVSVLIFGRSTPVELEFGQVEKQ